MFRCRKDTDKIVAMASWLVLGGALPLSVALVAQYGFGLHPCHFCLLQRYPYLGVMAAGVGCLLFKRMGLAWRACVAIGILGLLTTGTLGLIHTGIETKFLHYEGGCVAPTVAAGSIEDLRAAITAAPLVACDSVSAAFAGLSMASWNSIWALLVILLIAVQYRCERKRYGI